MEEGLIDKESDLDSTDEDDAQSEHSDDEEPASSSWFSQQELFKV